MLRLLLYVGFAIISLNRINYMISVRRHHLLSILSLLILLICGGSVYAENHGSDEEDSTDVLKIKQALKNRVDGALAGVEVVDDLSRMADVVRWQLLQRNDNTCAAFVLGSLQDMRDGGIDSEDFRPVSPPDLAAALGLATVYAPNTAGWFVAAGRRVHVKSTDAMLGYKTYSYESLARLGWATGVTSGTIPSARILMQRSEYDAVKFFDFINDAVQESSATGAWFVGGQVYCPTWVGRALRRSPVDGRVLNDRSEKSDPQRSHFNPVESGPCWLIFTALVVDAESESPSAVALRERFFADSQPVESSGLLIRVHAAEFVDPAPEIDPGGPFQEIWYAKSPKAKDFPRVKTVRRLLSQSEVTQAHVSVWAVDRLMEYDLYQEPELVDVLARDPTLLAEQMWATSSTLVLEPIYEKPRLLLRPSVAERIVRIEKRLFEEGYRLKLYDAYRPLSVTQRLWKLHPDSRYLAMPTVGSRHNRGAAVDITLTDLEGNDLEMPSSYLCFDERAHRNYQGMSDQARENMGLLTQAMLAEGFTSIVEEWWHFDAPGWSAYPVMDVPLWPDGANALLNQIEEDLIGDKGKSNDALEILSDKLTSDSLASRQMRSVWKDGKRLLGDAPDVPDVDPPALPADFSQSFADDTFTGSQAPTTAEADSSVAVDMTKSQSKVAQNASGKSGSHLGIVVILLFVFLCSGVVAFRFLR